MKLNLLTVILLASSQVYAYTCTCGEIKYSKDDIHGAIDKAHSKRSDPVAFNGSYPHLFENREGLKFTHCKGTKYVVYPLKKGEPFTRGPPGPDRVIYLRDSDHTFCGCATYRGTQGKGLVSCT